MGGGQGGEGNLGDFFGGRKYAIFLDLVRLNMVGFIILSMNPNNNLKSSIRAAAFKNSYIGGFHNPESVKKSKLQLSEIE